MSFASRVMHLKAEGAYQVLARAQELEAAGHDIIHLEIGEPDFSTAPHISMVGIKAIADGRTRYNPPSGLKELREAIAKKLKIEKLERIKTHYQKNKQDKRAMREKDRIFAQVRKLKKYFKVAIK